MCYNSCNILTRGRRRRFPQGMIFYKGSADMELKELRERAYEANMELWRKGLIIYTWGNVSELDPERGVYAIKPSGVPYEQLKAGDMVLVDVETGKKVDGDLNPSSDTPTHTELYRAFRGIRGVVHTHSTHATSFAQAGRGIPCYGTTHADYFHGTIPCTRFLTEEEVEGGYEANTGLVIAETFRNLEPLHTPAVLVRGHGPFTWGTDGMNAVHNAVVLEEVARMALNTLALSPRCAAVPEYVSRKHFLRKHGPNAYYGQTKK